MRRPGVGRSRDRTLRIRTTARLVALALGALLSGAIPAAGQVTTGGQRDDVTPSLFAANTFDPLVLAAPAGPTFVTVVAGERYAAGAVHRWVLGAHHRDVWTLPVTVPLLDLAVEAGGLAPVRRGGGMQTRSLRLEGADGRTYAFRSIDKDPSALLDTLLHETVLHDLLQDGISSAHPYGALVAAPLLRAAGVLHAEPRLVVMPDDPSLGEYRDEFGGMLGLLEERPDENDGAGSAFAGADKVIGSERLVERLNEGPNDRVDSRAYLRARLLDLLLGDWDRHRDQWRWATWDEDAPRRWRPIPRDRDQVFSTFDGIAPGVLRLYLPQFVRFGPEYGAIERLHWNARDIDRWFLAELDEAAWRSVGDSVSAALTDEVIDGAVRRLPPEVLSMQGAELAEVLRARRDRLPMAVSEFYALLARQIDLRLTDGPDLVRVERAADGSTTVSAASATTPDLPYLTRTLSPLETAELRVRMGGGDDVLQLAGPATSVRIVAVGGDGDDLYVVEGEKGDLQLYDHDGSDQAFGMDRVHIDRRPFEDWVWTPDDRDQPLEWGSRAIPLVSTAFETGVGALVGGGVRVERYGFRRRPWASVLELRGAVAPSVGKLRLEGGARFHGSNSSGFTSIDARVSQIDVLNFYGVGNDTDGGNSAHHRVDLARASLSAGAGHAWEAGIEVRGDVGVEYTRVGANPGRFIETLGSADDRFTTVRLSGMATIDPMRDRTDTGRRLRVEAGVALHPTLLDADRPFASTHVEAAALLAAPVDPAIALAVRGGARHVMGAAPWHHASFLGGGATLRGWDDERFSGDTSLFGGAELRLRLFRPTVIVPASFGVFGFADAGRVFVRGASPGGWHTGTGGGVFLAPATLPNLLRIGFGRSAEGTRLYAAFGLPY